MIDEVAAFQIPPEHESSTKDLKKIVTSLFERFGGDMEENLKQTKINQKLRELTEKQLIYNQLFSENAEEIIIRLYVVTNKLTTKTDKALGILSRVFTSNVGVAHLGIQINNKIVHWLDCDLVLIKEWEGKTATALFYPQNKEGEELKYVEDTEENRRDICEVIQKWNCTKMYDQKNANCQMFAKEIFKVLNLNENFLKMGGPIGDFLRYISYFKSQTNDIHPCFVKDNVVVCKWETHEQLDDWCRNRKNDSYEMKLLLKGFHRAFQLRGKEGKDCPDSDPTMILPKEKTTEEPETETNMTTNIKSSFSKRNQPNETKQEEEEFKEIDLKVTQEVVTIPSQDIPEQNTWGVKTCKHCNVSFGFWIFGLGKKHCNLCKQVFCEKCLPKEVCLPEGYQRKSFSSPYSTVCNSCFDLYTKYSNMNKINYNKGFSNGLFN